LEDDVLQEGNPLPAKVTATNCLPQQRDRMPIGGEVIDVIPKSRIFYRVDLLSYK